MDNMIFTIVVSSITGFITFLLGAKRQVKETEGVALDNIDKHLEIYNKIISNLKDEISLLLEKVDALEEKVDELMKENCELKKMVENCNKPTRRKKTE